MKTFSCISDQHGCLDMQVNPCDFLLIAGDIVPLSLQRNFELSFNWINTVFLPWLDIQPAKHKIFIAGNHDFVFQDIDNLCAPKDIYYLRDESITLDGLNLYGSPWTPWFWDWAFNFPKDDLDGRFAQSKWAQIPEDVNILITHGPPSSILDYVGPSHGAGCTDLKIRIKQLKDLKLHCFGHLHQGFGHKIENSVNFVNAAYGYKNEQNYKTAPLISIDI